MEGNINTKHRWNRCYSQAPLSPRQPAVLLTHSETSNSSSTAAFFKGHQSFRQSRFYSTRTQAHSIHAEGPTSSSGSPSNGRRAGSVASSLGSCVRSPQTGCIAVAGSPSCTEPDACSPAVTAIGLPTQASRNRPVGGGLGNRKRSECGWAEARTCSRSFPISRRACTGGPTSVGVASTMWPKSDRPSA
jgi:hypothetical protein